MGLHLCVFIDLRVSILFASLDCPRAAERGSLRHDAERSSDGTGETLASLCYAASEQRLTLRR